MSLYGLTEAVPEYYIISIINSTFMSYYVDTYVNNTQTFQINDARQLPIIVPNSQQCEHIKELFNSAVIIKKTTNNEYLLDKIQTELDETVFLIYSLK